jgi:hypothetical protein
MTGDEHGGIIVVAEVSVTVETPRPAARAVIDEHWCMHAGCKRWGSFGFQTRKGTEWYCGEHRCDGY